MLRLAFIMNAKGNWKGSSADTLNSQADFVIQDRACGIYFAGLGTWIASMERAFAFTTEEVAEEFARKQGLQNVQVVRRNSHGIADVYREKDS